MSNDANLIEYHKSITQELASVQHRVRNLIGDKHWQSDGEYKETVLRKVLQNHIPETNRVGRGFIFYEETGLSHQIDVLLLDKSRPTLFAEGDFAIVTPDTVRAILEVKATIHSTYQFGKIARKLADDAQKLRESVPEDRRIWVGLFAFESGILSDEKLLTILQRATEGNRDRIINALSFGADKLVRYIYPEDEREGRMANGWISYKLESLSSAYFISHTIWGVVDQDRRAGKFAWFPIHSAALKHGTHYIGINDKKPTLLPASQSR